MCIEVKVAKTLIRYVYPSGEKRTLAYLSTPIHPSAVAAQLAIQNVVRACFPGKDLGQLSFDRSETLDLSLEDLTCSFPISNVLNIAGWDVREVFVSEVDLDPENLAGTLFEEYQD